MVISDEALKWVQIINSLVGTLSLIFLVIYVIKTWQIASATKKSTEISEGILKEMEATREQEVAPYIVAYFDIEKSKTDRLPATVFFTVKNEGKTVAKNVKLEFDPPLPTLSSYSPPRNLNELHMIKNGIPVMPPGFQIRTTFGFFTSLIEKGLSYRVKISFLGVHDKPNSAEYILDLSPYSDLLYDFPQGMPQLIDEVKKTRESIDRVREKVSSLTERIDDGLWLRDDYSSTQKMSLTVEEWKAAISSKLNEYKLSWDAIYGVDYDNLNDDLSFSNLKSYYTRTGERLIHLLSLAPSNVPHGIREGLLKLSSGLLQVEAPKHICREEDLNKYGKEFVVLADHVLKELAEFVPYGTLTEEANQ